jgi:pimeloyl-ACP methyl ester carboxylesterase
MPTYVLIHGSWHHGELWKPVRKELEARGHEVHTPTCGGLGAGDDPAAFDHASSRRVIADYITSQDLRDFVLVGHSGAGGVIMKLAEEFFPRIRRLVFQNAFVPLDGNAILDEVDPVIAEELHKSYAERADGGVECSLNTWREMFMNDADLETAVTAYRQLRPHPFRTLTDKVDYSRFYSLGIPRSYLNFLEDNAIGQSEQWGWHPRMSSRLGVFRLVQAHGCHEVMFTNPRLLAEKLIEAGRD